MASVDKQAHEGVCVLRLRGDLDVNAVEYVRADLLSASEEAGGPVVFDLSQVPYLGSMALALLAEAAKHIKADGRQVLFCGLRGTPLQLFRVTKLDQAYHVCKDLDETFEALGVPKQPE